MTTQTAPAPQTIATGISDPPWFRRLFIGITVLFLTLFIVLPAANVFVQAFSKGASYYAHTFYAPKPVGVQPSVTDFDPGDTEAEHKKAIADFDAASAPWKAHESAEINRGAVKLTLLVVAVVVPLNALFGLTAAWLVTRFRFPGRALLISLIDLPFSVSPVVSGLIFVLIFGLHGILTDISHAHALSFLNPQHWNIPDFTTLYWRGFSHSWWPIGAHGHDIGIIDTQIAVIIATAFVTFPFVARTLIPVMAASGSEEEVAALSLGANGWQMFRRVTIPNVKWGLFYGLILCTARTCGEFGAASVVGPKITQKHTMPLRIADFWDGSNIPGAFALSSLLTLLAVGTLAAKSFIEWRMARANRPITLTPESSARPT